MYKVYKVSEWACIQYGPLLEPFLTPIQGTRAKLGAWEALEVRSLALSPDDHMVASGQRKLRGWQKMELRQGNNGEAFQESSLNGSTESTA